MIELKGPAAGLSINHELSTINFCREVIRLLDCKSGVIKHVSEATNWSVTSTSHHFSGKAKG